MTDEKTLRAGLAQLRLPLSHLQVAQLLDYAGLIRKWNKTYNLTALSEPADILTHHLLDSLSIIAALNRLEKQGPRVLDVGSGGGLPGVVIAICCAAMDVTCVDAVAKKTAFIQHVAMKLQLPNLRGLHARVEALAGPPFDIIISRAFASLADFTAWSSQALAPDGVWLAMKGKNPEDEVAKLPANCEVFHVEHLHVPGLSAQRCLVWLRPRA